MDSSPPGSPVHGIPQARILERFAISSSRGSSRPRDQTHVSSSPALAGGFFTTVPPGKPIGTVINPFRDDRMSPREVCDLPGPHSRQVAEAGLELQASGLQSHCLFSQWPSSDLEVVLIRAGYFLFLTQVPVWTEIL